MKRDNPNGGASYVFDEVAIWKTRLPEVKHAVLPPSNNRPNPLATEDMVFASVFSPGAVCALERKTGKLIWHRDIPKLGGATVHLAQGKLFAQDSNTVFALEPETGKTIWSFCPYGDINESIYSQPTFYRNSVFVGDRIGFLHCLDSQTGETLWKRRTNRMKNCSVNSTPVVTKGLVIISTNAKMAAAYDAKTGKPEWISKLDGPSTFGPLLFRDLVAVVTDSIYLLEPESGKVVRRFSWKPYGVSTAGSTNKGIIALLRGKWPPDGNVKLVGLNEDGVRFTENCRAFVAFLHYATETKLIYVSHLGGIDVRRPETGALVFKFERTSRPMGIGPIDVKHNTVYALTNDGYVYALQHSPA